MKRILDLTIMFLFLFSLSGCSDYYELYKPSLVLEYYQGPYKWAGIELGKTSKEDTKNILLSLEEVVENTLYEGSRFSFIDIAVCVDFIIGYREDSCCIWFVDDEALFIEFFGNESKIEEIQTHLGEVEKFAVYMYRIESVILKYEGFSLESGYIIGGGPHKLWIDEDIETVTIDENSLFSVYFIHPDFFDEYYFKGSDFWIYFFEEGGFQDWHGYGEYEVQRSELIH